MKTILNIIILLWAGSSVFAQKLTPEVISSGGKHFKTGNYSLSYTVGELAVSTLKGEKTLTQGFHQGSLIVSDINEIETFDYQVKAFPNPTIGILYIDIENIPANREITFRIFDLTGREVNAGVFMNHYGNGQKATMDLQELINGTYIILMFADNQKFADVKVVKIY